MVWIPGGSNSVGGCQVYYPQPYRIKGVASKALCRKVLESGRRFTDTFLVC